MLLPIVANAYDFEVDGIYYNIISSKDLTVSVTNSGINKDTWGNISGKDYSGIITIPDKVVFSGRTLKVIDISTYAFNESNIETIVLPNTLKSIGNCAFEASKKLQSISIPNSVDSIGSFAFGSCSSLKKAIIEDSMTPLGIDVTNSYAGIFRLCPIEYLYIGRNIKRIISHDGGASWYDNNMSPFGFQEFLSSQLSIELGDKVLTLCDNIFDGAKKLLSIDIPANVNSIGESAFRNCIALKEIVIPSEVIEIRPYTFSGCSNLSSITLRSNLKQIGDGAFSECSKISSINLREELEIIGNSAFEGCASLSEISLPNTLKQIGSKSFGKCSSIIKVTSKAQNPPLAYDDSFSPLIYWDAELIVPYGANDNYKGAVGWKNFSKIEEDKSIIAKYHINYYVDNEKYKSYEVEYGSNINPEAEPTKEGYSFSGWSEIPETMPAHDVTVTGTFTINKYKLTYMIDNKVYKETMYEFGATITPEPQPEGDYATFEWINLPQTMPAHDVVVHANFTSGITEILMKTQRNIRIYSPNAKKLDNLQRGLNIILMDDGTVKKVVMK